MDKLTKRSELMKQIRKLPTQLNYYGTDFDFECLADFILADRKRICTPLVQYMDLTDCPEYGSRVVQAIEETLTLAGEM